MIKVLLVSALLIAAATSYPTPTLGGGLINRGPLGLGGIRGLANIGINLAQVGLNRISGTGLLGGGQGGLLGGGQGLLGGGLLGGGLRGNGFGGLGGISRPGIGGFGGSNSPGVGAVGPNGVVNQFGYGI